MKQEPFQKKHQHAWQRFQQWLVNQDNRHHPAAAETIDDSDFPQAYRRQCHQLSLARSRKYSHHLTEQLSRMVLQGHQHFYRHRGHLWNTIRHYLSQTFPQTIRQEWRYVLIATLLFYGPFLGMLIGTQLNSELIYTLLDGFSVSQIESMYDPELRDRLGRERESETDIMMFGHYIYNNTGIGFRTFASGLFAGIGSVFTLMFNGLYIGAVAGHLTHLGYIETFWGFVAGHSAMELTAIVFSGAAGLKIGMAIVRPGNRTRLAALVHNAKIGINIMFGTAAMFFIAAFIEAFWSSIAWMPFNTKIAVGLFMWAVVIFYFFLTGRSRRAA